ncbi:MAG: SDR family NAD(P)-dependent oxidoreductase [Parvularcula sp.]
MSGRLQNKKAVITGAARGIGEAIAAAFIEEGATVLLTDVDEVSGRAAAQRLGMEFMRLDVASEADWLQCEETHPDIDILVNNAGITGFEEGIRAHDPEHASLDDWRHVHRVNLDGTFLGCRYAIRAMKKKGAGSIINISSRSGMVGIPMATAYASSKAAIRNHTKSVALYCAHNGWDIRCNSIHPAAVMTPMWEPMLGSGPEREKNIAAFVADTPQKRFGEPEEVAALAVLLASDEARYITGTEVTIDGGILAGSAASPTTSD